MQIDSIAPNAWAGTVSPLATDKTSKAGLDAEAASVLSPQTEGSGQTFGQMLQSAIGQVNDAQLKAGDMTARFAAGDNMDVHQVMIASQEASVALNLAMQVRNKLVDGYQEVMRVNM